MRESITSFIGRLQEQAQLARDLAALAQRQAALIERGDAEALLLVLEHRQELIDAIQAGQEDMPVNAVELEEKCSAASPAHMTRISELVETIQSHLADVLAVDAADAGQMKARLSEMQAQRKAADAGGVARAAYGRGGKGGRGGADPRFTDRKV